MDLLKDSRVYLAGAVDNDENRQTWRDDISIFLKKLGVHVYDPLVKPKWLSKSTKVDPSNYFKAFDDGSNIDEVFKSMDEIRTICLAHVAASDFIICHMPMIFTVGTISELERAVQMNKPVLFHCPEKMPPSTWALQHATSETFKQHFFKDWNSLKTHLRCVNSGIVKLDPMKWIHIAYTKLFDQEEL